MTEEKPKRKTSVREKVERMFRRTDSSSSKRFDRLLSDLKRIVRSHDVDTKEEYDAIDY